MFPQLRSVLLGALIVGSAQANYAGNLAVRDLGSLFSEIVSQASSILSPSSVQQSISSQVSITTTPLTSSISSAPPASLTPLTSPSATGVTVVPTSSSSKLSSPSPASTPSSIGDSSPTPSINSGSTTADPAPTSAAGQQYTTIIITTSGGITWSFTSIGTSPSSANTALPILNDGSTSGLDPNTRKTVIGVVVGVGGAVFLALIFLVVWKLWGRSRYNVDEDDGLMMDTTHVEKSKSESGSSINPFKSTLESYHNPAKTVNASSNF